MNVQTMKDFEISDHRVPDHPVDPQFVGRWSPRAFDGAQMPEDDLKTILEAARWAPSAYNIQPWRFVYVHRGDANWDRFVSLMVPFNQDWAKNASALVYLFSDSEVDGRDGKPNQPNGTHSFDAGAAWAQAALQASLLGYHSHAMSGLHMEKINEALGMPERLKPQIAIAIGNRADPSTLPEGLKDREEPSPRKPWNEIAFRGGFGA